MKVGRSAFACALAGLIAGGIVAGNLWVRWHFERERAASPFEPRAAHRLSDHPHEAMSPALNAILSSGWQPERREGPAFGELPPEQPPEPIVDVPAAAPKRFPLPERASPIARDAERDSRLLNIITEELPNVSAEDRHIWLERVRDLPPQAVREMLRLRRSLGSPLDAERPEPALPSVDDASRETADPHITPHSPPPPIESALAALQHARSILLNNLANADTDGFKRIEVSFRDLSYELLTFDAVGDGTANIAIGRGVRLAPTELDLTQGTLRSSIDPLHVAIDGDGFFQVSDGKQVLYTRLGRFSADAEGSIVLTCGAASLGLHPSIELPPDTTEIRIDQAGAISARTGDAASWTECGRLTLARFANAAALVPRGDGLFAASPTSGPPRIGTPGERGLGLLTQFALESSNVDPGAEIAALEHIQQRMGQLQRLVSGDASAELPIARRAPSPPSSLIVRGHTPMLRPVRHWLEQLAGVVERTFSETAQHDR